MRSGKAHVEAEEVAELAQESECGPDDESSHGVATEAQFSDESDVQGSKPIDYLLGRVLTQLIQRQICYVLICFYIYCVRLREKQHQLSPEVAEVRRKPLEPVHQHNYMDPLVRLYYILTSLVKKDGLGGAGQTEKTLQVEQVGGCLSLNLGYNFTSETLETLLILQRSTDHMRLEKLLYLLLELIFQVPSHALSLQSQHVDQAHPQHHHVHVQFVGLCERLMKSVEERGVPFVLDLRESVCEEGAGPGEEERLALEDQDLFVKLDVLVRERQFYDILIENIHGIVIPSLQLVCPRVQHLQLSPDPFLLYSLQKHALHSRPLTHLALLHLHSFSYVLQQAYARFSYPKISVAATSYELKDGVSLLVKDDGEVAEVKGREVVEGEKTRLQFEEAESLSSECFEFSERELILVLYVQIYLQSEFTVDLEIAILNSIMDCQSQALALLDELYLHWRHRHATLILVDLPILLLFS